MDINSAFPSNYLKASDLQGKHIQLEIDDVRWESIGDEQKAVLYFLGKDKGLVLNKTNANAIAEKLGYETNNWHKKVITIFPTQTDFQGRTVPCIRVKLDPAATVAPPQAQPAETKTPDDDIPF
jgi:hypothetical protein